MRDTKWTHQVDLEPPELPEIFWELTGVTPVIGVVDDEVGEEILLLINDPTDGAQALADLDQFELNVASGAVDTEHGSLGFLLFIVPDQDNPEQPHAVWEILFDPHDEGMTGPFRRLAEQSHWHALLFGPGPDILDVLEFENSYFLDAGLLEVDGLVDGKPCTDFEKAVHAAHDAYSLEELYAASTSETVNLDS